MDMWSPTEALWIFLAAFAVSVALLVYALLVRPRWMHLDYDALLWQWAWGRTLSWARGYLREELTVLISAVVIAFVSTHGTWERIVAGVVTGLGAFVLGAVLLFLYYLGRAPSAMYSEEVIHRKNVEEARDALIEQQKRNEAARRSPRSLNEAQCEELSKMIEDYHVAINLATKAKFSRDARQKLKDSTRSVSHWLENNLYPTHVLFDSAPPVMETDSRVPPGAIMQWQLAVGRLRHIQDVFKRLCN